MVIQVYKTKIIIGKHSIATIIKNNVRTLASKYKKIGFFGVFIYLKKNVFVIIVRM